MFKLSAEIREAQRKAKRDITRGLISQQDAAWRIFDAMLKEGVDNRALLHFFSICFNNASAR